ncbi:MAG: phosphotransferase [Oceanicola sp.]|nr:phosphotransferase [Oceanicola sp.]
MFPEAHQITAIAGAWGPLDGAPRLVAERENAVYAVRLADGRQGALRLHRPGYRSRAEITAELRWTDALAAIGLPCPRPLACADGALMPETEPCASMVSWLEGTAPQPDTALTAAHAHAVGLLLRQLHDSADSLPLPAFPGVGWTFETLLGPEPRMGRFWENPALSARDQSLLKQTAEALPRALEKSPLARMGLIHADPLRENMMLCATGLHLIDFDDCGTGVRGYDLGTALVQTVEAPGLEDRISALCDGYGLPDIQKDLPGFILLRALASCGWAMTRLPQHDPRVRHYADRACALAQSWSG